MIPSRAFYDASVFQRPFALEGGPILGALLALSSLRALSKSAL